LGQLRGNTATGSPHGTPAPAPELAADAVTWLIWRKDLAPHFRSLSELEAWALRAAHAGSSFPALCAALCEWVAPQEAAGVAAGWLRTWIDDELIMQLTQG